MNMVTITNGTTFITSGEGGVTINSPYTTRQNLDLEAFSLDPNAFGDFTLIPIDRDTSALDFSAVTDGFFVLSPKDDQSGLVLELSLNNYGTFDDDEQIFGGLDEDASLDDIFRHAVEYSPISFYQSDYHGPTDNSQSYQDSSLSFSNGQTVELVDFEKAVLSGGVFIEGTDGADSFTTAVPNGGLLIVQGGDGVDDYKTYITHFGTFGLDFNHADVTSGIVLTQDPVGTTGLTHIEDDGFGNEETLIGLDTTPTDGAGTVTSVSSMHLDIVTATKLDDEITLNDDDNAAFGLDGADTISGGGGDDFIIGGTGDDILEGGDGDDYLEDGMGSDEVYGGAGDDTINNIGGSDLFDGGDGSDTLITDISTGFDERSFVIGFDTVAGTHGRLNSTVGQDTITNIENFTLKGNFNVVVTGGDEDNVFTTDQGEDRLIGGAGDDTLIGGNGRDRLFGGDGNDILDGSEGDADTQGPGDYIRAGLGQDTIIGHEEYFNQGGEGAVISYGDIAGIGGVEITVTDALTGAGTVTSRSDTSIDDQFTYVRAFQGSADDDIIRGGTGHEVFAGLEGNDILYGGTGGSDLLQYNDDRYETGGGGAVTVNFELGTAIDGFGDTDTFFNMEEVRGSELGDTFIGSANDERMLGVGGNDTMLGGDGEDRLIGGAGDDNIYGDGSLTTYTFNAILTEQDENWTAVGLERVDLELGLYQDRPFSYSLGDKITFWGGEVVRMIIDQGTLFDSINFEGYNDSFEAYDPIISEYSNVSDERYILIEQPFKLNDTNHNLLFAIYSEGDHFDQIQTLDDWFDNSQRKSQGLPEIDAYKPGIDIDYTDAVASALASKSIVSLGSGDDILEGGDGDDYLEDGMGSDEVYGGAGDDTINNIGGSDLFDGGDGSDTLITDISTGFDERSFVIGFDTVAGTHGRLNSDLGQDTIADIENFTLKGNFNAVVTGGDDDNIFTTDAGDDVIRGGAGDDRLSAWIGNDEVYAGSGNDTIINTGGEDLFDGGEGVDTLITDLSQSVKDKLGFSDWDFDIVFDLTAEDPHMRHYAVKPDGTDYAWDEIYGIENYTLIGDFDVKLTGDAQANILVSDTGDDVIRGGAGDDLIDAGDGIDYVNGGLGNDTYQVIDNLYDFIEYTDPNNLDLSNHINISDDGGANDVVAISDTPGRDSYRFVNTEDSLIFQFASGRQVEMMKSDDGSLSVETFRWFHEEDFGLDYSPYSKDFQIVIDPENIRDLSTMFAGTDLGDTVVLPSLSDTMSQDNSNGWAEIYLNAGDDTVTMSKDLNFLVHMGAGNDTGYGQDEFAGSIDLGHGDDAYYGGDGDDRVSGAAGDDLLRGGNGNDILKGAGGDWVWGAGIGAYSDDDALYGENGNDLIESGVGSNSLSGGAGNDTIVLDGNGTYGSGFAALNISSSLQTGTEERINLNGKTRFEDVMDGGADADTVELTDASDAFFLHDSFSGFHSSLSLSDDYAGELGTARIENIENINAGDGDDIIDLTSPDYSLAGQNITVDGGEGNDTLWGSDADEALKGGNGDDELFGGAGVNELIGGAGADEFQFTKTSANDTVADFKISDGDTLKFFNTGGAEFDRDSIALNSAGDALSIAYGSGVNDALTISLTNAGLQLDDLTADVLIIV